MRLIMRSWWRGSGRQSLGVRRRGFEMGKPATGLSVERVLR